MMSSTSTAAGGDLPQTSAQFQQKKYLMQFLSLEINDQPEQKKEEKSTGRL